MEHHFDIEVAQDVGVIAATIYKNIQFWCEKNRANGKHFYEGKYWTYNSRKALLKLFPYLTESQLKTGLQKLEEMGYIAKGSFNENPYDRTNWYCDLHMKCAFKDNWSTGEKSPIDCSEIANRLSENRQCITYNKPDINTDIKHLNINSEQGSLFDLNDFEDIKKPANENKKTLRQDVIEFWLKEFHPGWNFNATDGKKINSLIKKIQGTLKLHRGDDFTDEDTLNLFKHFCYSLDDFYKNETLSVLESKYDSIVERIKQNRNGKKTDAFSRRGVTNFKFNVPDPRGNAR